MRQRTFLVAAAVLAGAAATAIAATAAVNAFVGVLSGPNNRPLSQEDVQRELAAGPSSSTPASAPAVPSSTARPDGSAGVSPAASATRVLTTGGGTIVARCSGGKVTLVSWSPAQGYRTDDVTPGPADSAWVKFKAGRNELVVTVVCEADVPKEAIATDDHHQ